MTTTTDAPEVATPEAAAVELAAAVEKRDEFHAAVAAGLKVPKPADLLAVDAAVTVADLKLQGAQTRAAQTAEVNRQAAIVAIRASLTDGAHAESLAAKRARIVALVDTLTAGYEDLLATILDHDQHLVGLAREMRALGELPDDLAVSQASNTLKVMAGGATLTEMASEDLAVEPLARA